MLYEFPLVLLLALPLSCRAYSLPDLFTSRNSNTPEKRQNTPEMNPNGSEYIWIQEDVYAGAHFFEYDQKNFVFGGPHLSSIPATSHSGTSQIRLSKPISVDSLSPHLMEM